LAGGVDAMIYPNPSTGVFNIKLTGFTGGDIEFTVIDALGRMVTTGIWISVNDSFETVLDVSDLENGLYRLSLISNGIPSSIQLVKAN
jgi:hypothetical protein